MMAMSERALRLMMWLSCDLGGPETVAVLVDWVVTVSTGLSGDGDGFSMNCVSSCIGELLFEVKDLLVPMGELGSEVNDFSARGRCVPLEKGDALV